jgi:hypothetical protein
VAHPYAGYGWLLNDGEDCDAIGHGLNRGTVHKKTTETVRIADIVVEFRTSSIQVSNVTGIRTQ